MSDLNPNATITSNDGVSAYDSISRRAMLEELEKVPGGREVLPFVLMFYGSPTSYLWEDDNRVTQSSAQGEGVSKATPLCHCCLLGQHPALVAIQSRLDPSKKVFAFLDDIYIKSEPSRVGVAYTTAQEELFNHCHIRVHTGKTGFEPGRRPPPKLVISLRGLPSSQIPMPAFGKEQVCQKWTKGCAFSGHLLATQSTLRLSWRLWRSNTRSSWTGYFIREVRLECSFSFAQLHDEGVVEGSLQVVGHPS